MCSMNLIIMIIVIVTVLIVCLLSVLFVDEVIKDTFNIKHSIFEAIIVPTVGIILGIITGLKIAWCTQLYFHF